MKCKGTAKLMGENIVEKKHHTCGSSKQELEILKTKNELKTIAENSSIATKVAFDEYSGGLDTNIATQISYYNGIEAAMRWRRSNER